MKSKWRIARERDVKSKQAAELVETGSSLQDIGELFNLKGSAPAEYVERGREIKKEKERHGK